MQRHMPWNCAAAIIRTVAQLVPFRRSAELTEEAKLEALFEKTATAGRRRDALLKQLLPKLDARYGVDVQYAGCDFLYDVIFEGSRKASLSEIDIAMSNLGFPRKEH